MSSDSCECRENHPSKGYSLLGHEWKISHIFYTFYPLWKKFGRGDKIEIYWIVEIFVKICLIESSLLRDVNEFVSVLFVFIVFDEIRNNGTAQSAVGS
jgi:hypothetical protein